MSFLDSVTEVMLEADGRFELTDVLGESVSLGVKVKGYRFSKRSFTLGCAGEWELPILIPLKNPLAKEPYV
jgi:hypothetical protein